MKVLETKKERRFPVFNKNYLMVPIKHYLLNSF